MRHLTKIDVEGRHVYCAGKVKRSKVEGIATQYLKPSKEAKTIMIKSDGKEALINSKPSKIFRQLAFEIQVGATDYIAVTCIILDGHLIVLNLFDNSIVCFSGVKDAEDLLDRLLATSQLEEIFT